MANNIQKLKLNLSDILLYTIRITEVKKLDKHRRGYGVIGAHTLWMGV